MKFSAALAILAISLSSCVTPGSPDNRRLAAIASFSQAHPAPANLGSAVSAHKVANSMLMQIAKEGLFAMVTLKWADGSTATGYDEYFSSLPNRLHEVRPNYEGILVGDTGCMRETEGKFECKKMEFTLGLRELTPEMITSVEESTEPCGDKMCKSFLIHEINAETILDRLSDLKDPQSDYYLLKLVIKDDGSPFSFMESNYVDGKMTGAEAVFYFHFDAVVKPFDLPKE